MISVDEQTNPEEFLDTTEDLTEEDLRLLKNMATPQSEDRQSIFNFFNRVIKSRDSIKTGNLEENELSAVRLIRQTSLYAGMMGWDFANVYLDQKAETVLASSLSKKALLLHLAVTQKRLLSTRHLRRGQKKKWFGGTQEEQDTQEDVQQ